MRVFSRALAGTMLAACITLAGCSISYSIGKFSDSSKSISTSSSSEESASQAYEADIRALTAEAIAGNASADAYVQRIGRIAERHGVTDWERESGTFTAIGAGLKLAGVPETQATSLGMLRPVLEEAEAVRLVLKGYRS